MGLLDTICDMVLDNKVSVKHNNKSFLTVKLSVANLNLNVSRFRLLTI